MKVRVRVKPGSRKVGVEDRGDFIIVRVKAPPVEGRANREMIEVLSDYFGVPKSRIRIVAGQSSRNKLVEIEK